jgi:hypothetical protein
LSAPRSEETRSLQSLKYRKQVAVYQIKHDGYRMIVARMVPRVAL